MKHSFPWMFKKNVQIKVLYEYTLASEAVKQSVWAETMQQVVQKESRKSM